LVFSRLLGWYDPRFYTKIGLNAVRHPTFHPFLAKITLHGRERGIFFSVKFAALSPSHGIRPFAFGDVLIPILDA
jgi:hypothetical protein